MKIWITKWALTEGILVAEAELHPSISESRAVRLGVCFYYEERDWWDSELKAMRRAEEMLLKKISSVKKQLSRLQTMTIKIKECKL